MGKKIEVILAMKDAFSNAFKRPLRAVSTFTKKAGGLFKKLGRAIFSVKGLLAGLGAAVTVAGIVRLVTTTADFADNIGKLSTRLGETTEFLSEMAFVADRSNVPFNALSQGIQRLGRRLGDFQLRRGLGGEAKAGFDVLGLSDIALNAKSVEELIPKLADAFANLESSQLASFAAQKLFDSEGVVFLQFLKDGSKGIADLREEARTLGLQITSKDAKAAAEFNDVLTNLKASFTGLARTVILPNLPEITKVMREFVEFVVSHQAEVREFFSRVFQTIRENVPTIIKLFENLVRASSSFFELPVRFRILSIEKDLTGATLREAARGFEANVNQKILDSGLGRQVHRDAVERQRAAQRKAAAEISAFIDEKSELEQILKFLQGGGGLSDLGKQLEDVRRKAEAAGAASRAATSNPLQDLADHLGVDLKKLGEMTEKDREAIARLHGEAFVANQEVSEGKKRTLADVHREQEAIVELTTIWDDLRESVRAVEIQNRVLFAALDQGTTQFADAVLSFADGTKKLGEAFADAGKSILRTLTQILLKALATKAILAGIGAVSSFASSGNIADGRFDIPPGVTPTGDEIGPLRPDGTFAHGGIGHHGSGQLIAAHGTEAHIPTKRGAIPIRVEGGGSMGGGDTNIFMIDAIDVQSFEDRLGVAVNRNPEQIAAAVARASQRTPGIARSMRSKR